MRRVARHVARLPASATRPPRSVRQWQPRMSIVSSPSPRCIDDTRTKRDHVWQAFSRRSSKNSAQRMGSLEDICSRALRRDYLAALDDMLALTLTAGHRGMSFPAEYKWQPRWDRPPSTPKPSGQRRKSWVGRRWRRSVLRGRSEGRNEAGTPQTKSRSFSIPS